MAFVFIWVGFLHSLYLPFTSVKNTFPFCHTLEGNLREFPLFTLICLQSSSKEPRRNGWSFLSLDLQVGGLGGGGEQGQLCESEKCTGNFNLWQGSQILCKTLYKDFLSHDSNWKSYFPPLVSPPCRIQPETLHLPPQPPPPTTQEATEMYRKGRGLYGPTAVKVCSRDTEDKPNTAH